MYALFLECSSLKYLPDISVWNTSNVKYISLIFYGCSSLISIPDISKWNINKVCSIFGLFYKCSSLESLPDISKWNINSSSKSETFKNIYTCQSDINKLLEDIGIVTNMSILFYECSSLKKLPDISK